MNIYQAIRVAAKNHLKIFFSPANRVLVCRAEGSFFKILAREKITKDRPINAVTRAITTASVKSVDHD